ncbi:MAG: alpha/beta fold hydrolase [Cellulomonas sp.]
MVHPGATGIDYVLGRHGSRLAVLFHGGHLRAELRFAQGSFVAAGWSVLHVSRPGYGATALTAGPDPARFVDSVASLCRSLGFERVCAVGISGGGPTAMTFAARHPDLVCAVVRESAVSFAPWPDARTRAGAHVFFNPVAEPMVWAGVRALFRTFPRLGLLAMMRPLTTLPAADVVEAMSSRDLARALPDSRLVLVRRGESPPVGGPARRPGTPRRRRLPRKPRKPRDPRDTGVNRELVAARIGRGQDGDGPGASPRRGARATIGRSGGTAARACPSRAQNTTSPAGASSACRPRAGAGSPRCRRAACSRPPGSRARRWSAAARIRARPPTRGSGRPRGRAARAPRRSRAGPGPARTDREPRTTRCRPGSGVRV